MSARVLLLHGLLSGGAAWGGVQRELGDEYETISPDLPGYGISPAPAEGYSPEAVVASLLPLVEREQPDAVVGHSMGAILALALAAAVPGQFARVGLIGLPVYHDRADGISYLRHRSPVHPLLLRNDEHVHYACRALHQVRRAWLPVAPVVAPGFPREALECLFNHQPEGHAGGLTGVVFADEVHHLAHTVQAPVSALHGARDRVAPLERVRDLAGRHGWELRVAPTGGHQLFVRRPTMTARWLREHVLR